MKYIYLSFLIVLVSCGIDQVKLNNYNKGLLKGVMELKSIESKSFLLDVETAPRPHYVQLIQDSLGNRTLTFLNKYNNTIYLYDYENLNYIKHITFKQEDMDSIKTIEGYHIKNIDSIYLYSGSMNVFLTNESSKILKKISLLGELNTFNNPKLWFFSYPEYSIKTTVPFIQTPRELLLSGQLKGDIPDSLVNKFKFTAHMDFKLDSVFFTHTYPTEIYGNNYNWGGSLPMEVFPLLHPDQSKIIYSFVPSHHVYLSSLDGLEKYDTIFAGSNSAGTISSLEKKTQKMGAKEVVSNFVRQDRYCAILYDEYRKVYYRFMRKAIPNASKETHWNEKEIVIIIMDENFKYLGESVLGPGNIWNWQNSFITQNGLNIEYIDENDIEEAYLNFQVFTLTELN